MVYSSQVGVIVPHIQKFKKQLIVAVAAIFMATVAAMTLSASALTAGGTCNFDETTLSGTWTLQGDCESTSQINVPTGTILDGGGYTITPTFTKTDSDNNAALGLIGVDGVTIHDLTIDGSNVGAENLHGINVYQSTNVEISNVTVKDSDNGGIIVNGSMVTVSEVTTSGNGWYGINVDKVGAVLNITGTMHQTDNLQIYVDDTTTGATVNDELSQYNVSSPEGSPDNDQLYTLKTVVLSSKDDCKNGGWATSVVTFKNQGQCVSHFASNEKSTNARNR